MPICSGRHGLLCVRTVIHGTGEENAATSASQYVNIASSSGLQQAVDQMNQDYIDLGNALSGP